MAYPDFLSSKAPDYVDMFLGVRKTLNDMQNNTAQTQTAIQRAATDQWMAQIAAEKARQEAEMAPQEMALRQAKFELDVKDTAEDNRHQVNELEVRKAHQNYLDMQRELALQEKKEEAEQQLALNELAGKIGAMNPDEATGDAATKAIQEVLPKLKNDARKAYGMWDQVVKTNPVFRIELERKQELAKMAPEAKKAFRTRVDLDGNRDEAMGDARAEQQAFILRKKTEEAEALAKARTEGKGNNTAGYSRDDISAAKLITSSLKDSNMKPAEQMVIQSAILAKVKRARESGKDMSDQEIIAAANSAKGAGGIVEDLYNRRKPQ